MLNRPAGLWGQKKGDSEMKIKSRCFPSRLGFTIVEVITVVAITAVLVGLLVPALSMVRRAANTVRQKAQFHSIDTALEAYYSDFNDDYPDSERLDVTGAPYCGAQKLAEALVGWDGFGFHPKSAFTSSGEADLDGDLIPEKVYDVKAGIIGTNGYTETADENIKNRYGPYLELEIANAVKLKNLYDPANLGSLNGDTFVLADTFSMVTHRGTRKKTGMPILYYRAHRFKTEHDYALANISPAIMNDRNIYEWEDNYPIFDLAPPWDTTVYHRLDPDDPTHLDPETGQIIFYNSMMNPNFSAPVRPYRNESYILLSAGPDGLYGTSDDIFNFEMEK